MIGTAWAQTGAGSPGGLGQLFASPIVPLALMFVVFYFLLIRPQQQKAKEHRTMLENLKKNDEVVTTGGLHGKVVNLGDQVVGLEIAQNVRVRVSRSQISSLVTPGQADEKDKMKAKEKGKNK